MLFRSWGKLSVNNLRNAIQLSSSISLDKFIYAIGIRHIGQENAKILSNFFIKLSKFLELFDEKKRNLILKNIEDLDGIGLSQITSIKSFCSNKKNKEIIFSLVKELKIQDAKLLNKDGKFSGKTIMFTGGFEKMSRSEAKSLVEENGGKVLGSISKKLNFLVAGNSKPTKSKIEKAKEMNVKIIFEAEWYKLLNI